MSDNTRINPGVGGDNIATEDMGTYKVPVVKIRVGANDVDAGDITAANPLPAQLSQGSAALTAANPLPSQLSQGNVAVSATNPLAVQVSVSSTAATATNPIPVQLSQSNAVITNANPIPTKIGDGTNVVGTTQGRNSDNQTPSGTAFQLDVSGPTAILNPCSNSNGVNSGGYDRQRATGFDASPAVGITAGSNQFAVPFSTTITQAVTGGNAPQTVTVATSANLKAGDYVSIGGANPEFVFVNAAGGNTINAVFKNSHSNTDPMSWFHYNVARDAGAGNNISLTGLSASAVYLFNQNTNLAELERSANGELDGASGNGTAIAAEYEWNGNPLANGNVLSGLQFDRGRNLNAKGRGTGSVTATLAANSTTLTLSAAPSTLQPGQKILLDRTGTNPETNYVGAAYVAGSTTVPLQIATQFSHTGAFNVDWDQHSALGPTVNGFLPDGIEVEEEALWDPVSQLFYIERSATQDAMPAANIVAENPALWNGATMDRARSGSAATLAAQSATGSELTTTPGNWSVNAQATAGTPSASKAAGAAGVRHVCNSVSITVAAGATPQTPIIVNLRDGASGAGTILQTWSLAAATNAVGVVAITGLNIVGSAATAMTLEFASANAATVIGSVNLNGYDTV